MEAPGSMAMLFNLLSERYNMARAVEVWRIGLAAAK